MSNTAKPNKPNSICLIIFDGWGYSEKTEHNAIAHAKTPNWDHYWNTYPHTLIKGSGAEVGLPAGQMGNSEVGHLNIGAGRVVYQEYTRVSRSIRTKSFFSNCTLVDAIAKAKSNNSALHIFGLLSPGGVHSHEEHIHAMVEMAIEQGQHEVYLHAFLDGRDTAPQSAAQSIEKMQAIFDNANHGRFASVIGRYYAMDRDHRWDRIKQTYDLMTQGLAEYSARTPMDALNAAYERGETDEFVKATAILGDSGNKVKINDNDVVIFMNYRSDRARQITRPFIEDDFDCFDKGQHIQLGQFVSLTEYSSNFDVPVAFPPQRLKNTYGEYISNLGLQQLRIAETEKYAHVTFFFNGGEETPFAYEDRILVSSPDVATYDLQPQMSAPELSEKLIEAINSKQYHSIICNFANPDMVGHTGNFEATVKAIEALDKEIGKIIEAIQASGSEVLLTADHGNAEQMLDQASGQAHTAHTNNPVPFVYIGRNANMLEGGALSDIAPTMLTLMDIEIPEQMSGRSLVEFEQEP